MLTILLVVIGLSPIPLLILLSLCHAASRDYSVTSEQDGHGEWPAPHTSTETNTAEDLPEITPQRIHGMHLHNHCPYCAEMMRRCQSLARSVHTVH